MNDDEFVVEVSAEPVGGTEDFAKEELRIKGGCVEGCDYSKRKIKYIVITDGSLISRCSFQDVNIKAGVLGGGSEPSTYMHCNFDGSRMRNLIPGRARFVDCSFRRATIRDMQFSDAEFIDCVFDGADISDVVFDADRWDSSPADPPAYEYRGNDFSSARLSNVSFRGGVPLRYQRLPQDERHVLVLDAERALAALAGEISDWADENARESAEVSLQILQRHVERKQRELLIEVDFLTQELCSEYSHRLIRVLDAYKS